MADAIDREQRRMAGAADRRLVRRLVVTQAVVLGAIAVIVVVITR